jgi:hypothetical protein
MAFYQIMTKELGNGEGKKAFLGDQVPTAFFSQKLAEKLTKGKLIKKIGGKPNAKPSGHKS